MFFYLKKSQKKLFILKRRIEKKKTKLTHLIQNFKKSNVLLL